MDRKSLFAPIPLPALVVIFTVFIFTAAPSCSSADSTAIPINKVTDFKSPTAVNQIACSCSILDSLTHHLMTECVKCILETVTAMFRKFGESLREAMSRENDELEFQASLEKIVQTALNDTKQSPEAQVNTTLKFIKQIEDGVFTYSKNHTNSGDSQPVEALALGDLITSGFGQWEGGDEIRYPTKAADDESFIQLKAGWKPASTNVSSDGGANQTDSNGTARAYVGLRMNIVDFAKTKLAETIPQLLKQSNLPTSGGKRTVNSDFIKLRLKDRNEKEVEIDNVEAKINMKHYYPAMTNNLVGFRGRRIDATVPNTQVCVYLENDRLETNGCKVEGKSKFNTTCTCNKLRSFMLLMDMHDVSSDYGLELLTNILCPLSVISLLLVITIFTVLKAIRTQQLAITRHLCCSILPGKLLLLTFVDRNFLGMRLPDGVCLGFALAAHYSYLAAFFWMGIEGIHFYIMIVSVFGAKQSRMRIYRIIGYCAPVLIIALVCAIGYSLGDKPYVTDDFCWLNGYYLWSFLGPVALIVMVNGVMLCMSLYSIFKSQPKSENEIQRNRSNRKLVLGSFSLATVLGLGWIWGFFIFMPSQEASLVFAYIFVLLNGSQGIFILFFQCVLNDNVRKNLAKLLTRKTTFSALSSTDAAGKSTVQMSISAPTAGTNYEKHDDDISGYHEWEPGYIKIVRTTETVIEATGF